MIYEVALRPFMIRDNNCDISIPQLLNSLDSVSYNGEIWKQICFSPYLDYLKEYYWISTYGRVFSSFSNNMMAQVIGEGDGWLYYTVRLSDMNSNKITLSVNRLVMMVFCPNPNYKNLVANHLDGDKKNNYLWNLEWASYSENTLHAYRTGLHKTYNGEACSNTRITESLAHDICRCLENENYTYKDICDIVRMEYNKQNCDIIYCIKSKSTWTHISSQYNLIPLNTYAKYDESTVHSVCKCLEENKTSKEICELLNIPYDQNNIAYISKIKTKDAWKSISELYTLPNPIPKRFNDTEIKIICDCSNNNIKPKEICEKYLNIEYNTKNSDSIKYIKKKYNIRKFND